MFIWICYATKRGDPGIEPGTSCTLNRNHTTRPIALIVLFPSFLLKQPFSLNTITTMHTNKSIAEIRKEIYTQITTLKLVLNASEVSSSIFASLVLCSLSLLWFSTFRTYYHQIQLTNRTYPNFLNVKPKIFLVFSLFFKLFVSCKKYKRDYLYNVSKKRGQECFPLPSYPPERFGFEGRMSWTMKVAEIQHLSA